MDPSSSILHPWDQFLAALPLDAMRSMNRITGRVVDRLLALSPSVAGHVALTMSLQFCILRHGRPVCSEFSSHTIISSFFRAFYFIYFFFFQCWGPYSESYMYQASSPALSYILHPVLFRQAGREDWACPTHVAQPGLRLPVWAELVLSSWPLCIYLAAAGIMLVGHHTLHPFYVSRHHAS